ncbi:MAG: glycoside hydrolase family 9 protein, partial [Deltaproteobacteria bacterium]|nr:glycoside hydrolase family 9 protein [Deltaproteobacteria bacterium]
QVDISSLDTPGTYTVFAGNQQSDPFVIDEYWKVYHKTEVALVKSFYFQRTRTSLDMPYAQWDGDQYLRKGVSHVYPDVGWDYETYPDKVKKWQDDPDKQWWPGEQIKKGWFDAGNFDMYIPSTGPSAQILLEAYLLSPDLFLDNDQNIPESGNGVPDLLDEVTWGLDWIMSMQQKDGAFRHSEAVRAWTSVIPADKDDTVRWIRGISSSAAAKAVSVLAKAAVIYKKFPPYADVAAKYETAAKMGWEWLKAHPENIKMDGKGSPQPRWDDDPEHNDHAARFAAAAEMWLNFRDQSALAELKNMLFKYKWEELEDPKLIVTGSWVNISRYGLGSLALDSQTPEDIRNFAKKQMIAAGDELMPIAAKDGYLVVSSINDYYWGHNANLSEKTHLLSVVSKITGDTKYLQVARDQWHWLMGRNPNGYAMATRVGKGVTAVYHMEWGPFSPPPPGFAVGGPNYVNMPNLSPGAPAKAICWDNPEPTSAGTPAHSMFHWKQEDIWDGGFVAQDSWEDGWWNVLETDILYSAGFVLAGIAIR